MSCRHQVSGSMQVPSCVNSNRLSRYRLAMPDTYAAQIACLKFTFEDSLQPSCLEGLPCVPCFCFSYILQYLENPVYFVAFLLSRTVKRGVRELLRYEPVIPHLSNTWCGGRVHDSIPAKACRQRRTGTSSLRSSLSEPPHQSRLIVPPSGVLTNRLE